MTLASRSALSGYGLLIASLVEKMIQGDRRALARLFTLLERDPRSLFSIMRAVHSRETAAYRIGLTGPPGAGKSTLIDELIRLIRAEGSTVGILAIDPTSPFGGGAVLGDRIRMQRHHDDCGVFIRSLATRGAHGGLSRTAGASAKILDASGKDYIVIETVGVGQTELEIMGLADTVVVVLVPESGDSVQAMKAGLTEIADIFVVNKSDRPGADRLVASIEASVSLDGKDKHWDRPVLSTQAHRRVGIQALYDTIARHREAMRTASVLEQRRRERDREEFISALRSAVEGSLSDLLSNDPAIQGVASRVEGGEIDPYSAADEILGAGSLFAQLAKILETDRRGRS
jgi:LAO/AO transport system kinase